MLRKVQVVLSNGEESPIFAAYDNGNLTELVIKPDDMLKQVRV